MHNIILSTSKEASRELCPQKSSLGKLMVMEFYIAENVVQTITEFFSQGDQPSATLLQPLSYCMNLYIQHLIQKSTSASFGT